jgi:hypothetical protein
LRNSFIKHFRSVSSQKIFPSPSNVWKHRADTYPFSYKSTYRKYSTILLPVLLIRCFTPLIEACISAVSPNTYRISFVVSFLNGF